jgi:hypothetical protein
MADDIFEGNLAHNAPRDLAIRAIAYQLKKRPLIKAIINPIVTVENFK